MICEYCNLYTPHSLQKINNLIPEIKKKFMLNNVEFVCSHCYEKFKMAEQWHVKTQIIYSAKNREISKKLLNRLHS